MHQGPDCLATGIQAMFELILKSCGQGLGNSILNPHTCKLEMLHLVIQDSSPVWTTLNTISGHKFIASIALVVYSQDHEAVHRSELTDVGGRPCLPSVTQQHLITTVSRSDSETISVYSHDRLRPTALSCCRFEAIYTDPLLASPPATLTYLHHSYRRYWLTSFVDLAPAATVTCK